MQRAAAGDSAAGAKLKLRARAVPSQVRTLRVAATDFAEQCGVDRPYDVALAVGEAVSNAVRHAYPDGRTGSVELTGFRDDGYVTLLVEDQGIGLTPHVGGAGLGVGLGIMAQVAAEFSISVRAGGGTAVQLRFPTRAHTAGSSA